MDSFLSRFLNKSPRSYNFLKQIELDDIADNMKKFFRVCQSIKNDSIWWWVVIVLKNIESTPGKPFLKSTTPQHPAPSHLNKKKYTPKEVGRPPHIKNCSAGPGKRLFSREYCKFQRQNTLVAIFLSHFHCFDEDFLCQQCQNNFTR